MTPNDAPVGTLATIGHPANNIKIVKTGVGWRYLHNDQPVNNETFRAGWDTIPPATDPAAGQSTPALPTSEPGRTYFDVVRTMTTDPEIRKVVDETERTAPH